MLSDAADTDLTRILKMQTTFKHSFAIFYNISDEDQWNQLQCSVTCGTCRLLIAHDINHSAQIMETTVNAFQNTEKISHQRKYFTQVRFL